MDTQRPDPDQLLQKLKEEDARKQRAKLKIFFGMAPGVGKTYTMLKVARELRAEGVEVVIGVVETHGREETAVLAEGFEVLPKKTLPYRGHFLEEFDLQAALQRKPRLILMDELAHSNVQGSLHQKRWQDVWDLLDAGIDVYTTVNVQHLESLRDVVAQITGIIVQENIPDTILKRADEIEIVDLPPDELIQRLREGKVYVPDQARHAIDRFFRKGNLLALRELALRRVAEHVDADMRRYMTEKAIGKTWAAGERLLVCISPRPESSKLIRATKRMADSLNASWIAVYVENARGLRHSEEDRARLEEHLRLAERLGGESVVMQGGVHIAQDVINLATSRNVSKILVGKPRTARWLEFFKGSLLAELVRRSGNIDVHVITGEDEPGEKRPVLPKPSRPRMASIWHVFWAAVVVGLATGVGLLLSRRFELSEIVMVYLLGILVTALRFGRAASVVASVLSVLAVDLVFIPPTFSLTVNDFKHLGTFTVMLIVGYIIGNLVERVHAQTRLARSREQRTLALFRLTGELTRSGGSAGMVELAVASVARQFQSQATVFLPDAQGRLAAGNGELPEGFSKDEQGVAQWVFDHQEAAGLGTDILAGSRAIYLPLTGAGGILGVMGIRPEGVARWMEPDQRHLLDAFANQTALALERAILAEKEAENQRQMNRQKVGKALLSSVSQELLTPLADISEAISHLVVGNEDLVPEARAQRLRSIRGEVRRLRGLVADLLEATHLEAGHLEDDRSPVPVEALVRGALEQLAPTLGDREVKLELPEKLPPMSVNRPRIEHVLINLLENAHRFSPPDKPIEVKAWATEKAVTLAIADHGPGIPAGEEDRIFEKLVHLPRVGEAHPSAGLGLTVCKGIVEAHGGWIQAGNRPSGGAQILLSLPLERK